MEYYLAIKGDEILIYAAKGINLENMLNEISQTQKTNTVSIYLDEVYRIGKFIERESRMTRGWKEGEMGSY